MPDEEDEDLQLKKEVIPAFSHQICVLHEAIIYVRTVPWLVFFLNKLLTFIVLVYVPS